MGDRDKDFVTDGAKSGHFYSFGKPVAVDVQGEQRAVILVGEGYATLASAHAATGHACIVAFDAGNVPKVARVLRARFPHHALVFLADNDQWTDGNPGVTKAREAAAAVGGLVAVPPFDYSEGKPGKDGKLRGPSDFNDLHQLRGLDAVREVIEAALEGRFVDEYPAARAAASQALDAHQAQQAVAAIAAPVPAADTLAELGICALGLVGEHMAFWRADCRRVLLLRPGELGRHQGLQRLAPNQRWECWASGDFKPQQASDALIQICSAIGRVDLARVTDAPRDEVNAAFMHARAVAMPSPVALAELLALDTKWQDAIFFDEFAGRAACSKPLPCGGAAGPLVDEHDDLTAAFLGSTLGIEVTSKQAHDALNLLAKQNPRHPLREYLNGLRWDGTPRLERWLIDCAGSPDTVFVRAVSAKMLIAAVARAFDPGVKVDTCLVLEGAQGVKKSSLIAALVPERAWFAEDLAGSLSNKDALQGLSGRWLIELSELAATRKSTVEEVKSFLTRRVDSYRAPYGRRVADHPRQCVFFGSVNPAADGSWLFDATGGRRFWPVHVERADVAKVEQMRDQLWAEAVHAYHHGQQHWLTDDEEALATQEQKARLQENPWECALDRFVVSPQFTGTVATAEVFAFAQGRPPTSRDSGELRHIADALKARSWGQHKTGKDRARRWHPPATAAF